MHHASIAATGYHSGPRSRTAFSPRPLPVAAILAGEPAQFDLDIDMPAPGPAPLADQAAPRSGPTPGISAVQLVGQHQIRSFFGYHQSRESASSPWRFYVSSFGRTGSDGRGTCQVLLWGGGLECVPIDARHRISVLGQLYGPAHWDH